MTRNKQNGLNAELLFSFLLRLEYPRLNIQLNHSKGIDLIVNKRFSFEIKSCENKIKNGNTTRKGRFILRPNDFQCSYFVFMIPEIRYIKIIDKHEIYNLVLSKIPAFNSEYNTHYKLNRKELENIPTIKINELFYKINHLKLRIGPLGKKKRYRRHKKYKNKY